MKRFFALILFAASTAHAAPCEHFSRQYNTATTVDFCLYKYNSSATNDNEKLALKTDATFATGDIVIAKDEGTEANITTLPTDEGNCYSLPLSAGETSAARDYITIKDQTTPAIWIDKCLIVETYGNASAQHDVQSVNVSKWNGTTVAAPDTAGYVKATIKTGTGTGELSISSGAVTAGTVSDKTGYALSGAGVQAVWDALTSALTTSGSVGKKLADLVLGSDSKVILSNNAHTGAVIPTVTTVSNAVSLIASAIDSGQLTAAALNKIADYVLRRNSCNAEAASGPDTLNFQSLLGAVAQQTNKISNSGGSMSVYKCDNTSVFQSRTVTSNPAAAPITSIQ